MKLLEYEKQGRRRGNTFLRQAIGNNVLSRLQRVRNRYSRPESATHELSFIKQLEHLPMLDRQEIRDLAYKVDIFMTQTLANFTTAVTVSNDADEEITILIAYRYLSELTALTSTTPLYWSEYLSGKGVLTLRKAQSGLLRMMAPEWWGGRLNKMRNLQHEHMVIAVGQV